KNRLRQLPVTPGADAPAHGGTGQRRLILLIKNNFSSDHIGWGFALSTCAFFDPPGDDPNDYPDGRRNETKNVWDNQSKPDTADALLLRLGQGGNASGGGSGGSHESSAIDEAITFLRSALREGSPPTKEIQAAAATAGIAVITLRRARQALGVSMGRDPGPMNLCRWSWDHSVAAGESTQGDRPGS
ncbi:MAG: hypothetical protein AAGL98_07920, partial [Planctomycetota bacterium]